TQHMEFSNVTINPQTVVSYGFHWQRGGSLLLSNVHVEDSTVGFYFDGAHIPQKLGRIVAQNIDLNNGNNVPGVPVKIDSYGSSAGAIVLIHGCSKRTQAGGWLIEDVQHGNFFGPSSSASLFCVYERKHAEVIRAVSG
ncbi:MAG: hypothetical protein R3F19_21495, partial [Verrucomicrobiales bacterium]